MDYLSQWRLATGEPAPRQQSPVTCGSACLVVAQLLLEPALARWVLAEPETRAHAAQAESTGEPHVRRSSHSEILAQRFAELERRTMARTNGLAGAAGAMQLPWPRSLGTPPWGAMAELQDRGSLPGTRYEPLLLRLKSEPALAEAVRRLTVRVGPGRPALLYIGSPSLPRHVVLVFATNTRNQPLVYEPARGEIFALQEVGLSQPGLRLAGWSTPWLLIQPSAQILIEASALMRRARRTPPLISGASFRQSGVEPLSSTTSRTSKASASV